MKTTTKLLGFSAACAACCAVLPLAGSVLAGSTAIALLSESLEWLGIIGIAGVAGFLLWRLNRSQAKAASSCGCATASPTPSAAAPIACTLTPGDFKERIAWIRDLAKDSLLKARRDDLTLHLTYAKIAGDRVREMVDKEQACCAFMQFDLHEDARGVHLTMTAPENARAAAHDLFAHFAPELAATAQSTSQQKELT